jgi:hypothetical protein
VKRKKAKRMLRAITYTPGSYFYLRNMHTVELWEPVRDSRSKKRKKVMKKTTYTCCIRQMGKGDMGRMIGEMVKRSAAHESREWLRIDGKLVADPHKGG